MAGIYIFFYIPAYWIAYCDDLSFSFESFEQGDEPGWPHAPTP